MPSGAMGKPVKYGFMLEDGGGGGGESLTTIGVLMIITCQSCFLTSRSAARVILRKVPSIATCGTRTIAEVTACD